MRMWCSLREIGLFIYLFSDGGFLLSPWVTGDGSQPKPFECVLAPRSELAKSLVMQTARVVRSTTEVAY